MIYTKWEILHLTHVLQNVLREDILPGRPDFSRPDSNEVLDLLETMRKGYPLGSFVLYRVNEDRKLRTYILDGHKRLTALAQAFSVDSPPEWVGDSCDLEYNTITDRFEPVKSPYSMSANRLMDTCRFLYVMRRLTDLPDGDRLCKRADGLARVIHDYTMPVATITGATESQLKDMHERYSTGG